MQRSRLDHSFIYLFVHWSSPELPDQLFRTSDTKEIVAINNEVS